MVEERKDIGDYVNGTLVRPAKGGLWVAHIDDAFLDWAALFNPRNERAWNAGEVGQFRIYGTVPSKRQVLLTASDFGFMPISDRMRPRYLNASRALVSCLSEPSQQRSDVTQTLPGLVSEVKGMFNRCIKKDQWDWYDVWSGLGKPSFSDMNRIQHLLTDLRGNLLQNETTDAILAELRRFGLEGRLSIFLDYIQKTYSSLAGSRNSTAIRSRRTILAQHNPAFGARLIDKEKLDYANREHTRSLVLLRNVLDEMGYFPEDNIFIDLFARLRSGPAIFEVKSINQDNELAQVRSAVSQFYEYRYRHEYEDATLWLVLSKELVSDWVIPYLLHDRHIEVLWVEEDKLSGPSVEKL